MSEEKANQLWEQACDLPDGLAKVRVLDEAIREADLAAWLEGSYHIRVEMMQAATFSGASERLLAAFSWCLGKADELPEQFDDEELLWQYKWAISGALSFPGISLEQIQQMLEDFALRLRKHGFTQRPAAGLKMRVHQSIGELDQAAAVAAKWLRLERDDMADCEACERNHLVSLAGDRDEHELALQRAEPLLSGKLRCAEIPHETYPELLISAMRAGDEEMAKKMHIRGYRMIYRGPDFLRSLGIHGVYLARVRDIKKGADLIEKHLAWAIDSMEASSRKGFFIGALAIMRAMAGAGMTQASLRLPASHPQHGAAPCDIQEMIRWLEHEINKHNDAFDRRNGTSFCSDEAQRWLNLARC